MQALLDVILPVFVVIGAGYLTVWRGYFTDTHVDALTSFTQNFAIPCLLFLAMARLDLQRDFEPLLLLSYYAGAVACFLAGLFGARLLFQRDWPDCVAIGFCGLYSNTLLLGLPITERAYGVEALTGNFTIIAMHAPFAFLCGVTAMEFVRGTGQGTFNTLKSIVSSMSHNALVIAIALGLLINVLNLPIPGVVDDGLGMIAAAGLPAALFAMGGVLVRYKPEGDAKVIAMVCVIALILQPAVSWSLSKIFVLDTAGIRSVVLTAAMAPGINAYIFANMYGTARRVAASAVLFSTGFSILSVWVWLLILP